MNGLQAVQYLAKVHSSFERINQENVVGRCAAAANIKAVSLCCVGDQGGIHLVHFFKVFISCFYLFVKFRSTRAFCLRTIIFKKRESISGQHVRPTFSTIS